MESQYIHTQRAHQLYFLIPSLILFLYGCILFSYFSFKNSDTQIVIASFFIAFLVVSFVSMMISELTIRVEGNVIFVNFGLKFFKKRFLLNDIASTAVVTYPWYYGWGIHLTPQGWIYNIAGNKAVKVIKNDGTSFLLGTDDPEGLKMTLDVKR